MNKHPNPDMAKALRELRRSNAAGTHQDQREKRARSRAAKRQTEIKKSEEENK